MTTSADVLISMFSLSLETAGLIIILKCTFELNYIFFIDKFFYINVEFLVYFFHLVSVCVI